MIKRVAQLAMALSLMYYTLGLGFIWLGQILGFHNEIWDMYDFPTQSVSPPMWTLCVGLLVSALGMLSLGMAYFSVWKVLEGGAEQDFRDLGQRLRKMAAGLIGFWFFYNLLSGAVQYLIVM